MTNKELISQEQRKSIIINEFVEKLEAVDDNIKEFQTAYDKLNKSTVVQGVYSENVTGSVYLSARSIKANLNKSAWKCMFKELNLGDFIPKTEIQGFDNRVERGLEFTMENLTKEFKDYVNDPREAMLRAFANIFSNLDGFYKSHSNFGVGKKGLPKRIIIERCGKCVFTMGGGNERVIDTVNTLRVYRGEQRQNIKVTDEKTDKTSIVALDKYNLFNGVAQEAIEKYTGITFKLFKNGNCHVIFDKKAQDDINLALHEYYGDVLADEATDKPSKKTESTEVSKDLQFYATPPSVIKHILRDFYIDKSSNILEPSCGEGNIMLELIKEGYENIHGIEYDFNRAVTTRKRTGKPVICTNFLDYCERAEYDAVVMNPPFYGTHYMKHLKKAWSLLKEGGILVAILPASARYEHGLVDEFFKCKHAWSDLPLGSFKDSGTKINTCVFKIRK